jgi:hypothetical protein
MMSKKCFFKGGKAKLYFNFPYGGFNVSCFECKGRFLLIVEDLGVIGVYSYSSLMNIVSSFESKSTLLF